MSAVSLADVKAHLNIKVDSHDDELGKTLARAESAIAARVGPLEPVTVADEAHVGWGPIVLRHMPVVSVTSVTSGGADVTGYAVNAEAGVLYGSFGLPTLVTYQAGRASLPADLEAAVLELVRHLWESQRGIAPTPLSPDEGGELTGAGYLLPYRVQALIEPYLLPPTVA